jgi:aminoglycoside phosphotransferase
MKEKNKTLVAENTDLKKELNHLIKTFNMSELDSSKTNKKLKVKIELLEDEVKTQKSETNDALKVIEEERKQLKHFKEQTLNKTSESFSQTNTHPDVPYLITDPLPPIFSMELRYKSRPINFLSRSLPNLNSFHWCPPDDDFVDAAEEYLADQYDREIQEFYSDAQEQARAKHAGDYQGLLEQQEGLG